MTNLLKKIFPPYFVKKSKKRLGSATIKLSLAINDYSKKWKPEYKLRFHDKGDFESYVHRTLVSKLTDYRNARKEAQSLGINVSIQDNYFTSISSKLNYMPISN